MNPAKRKRLSESASTLSKPFKSPMRVVVKMQPSNDLTLTEQALPIKSAIEDKKPPIPSSPPLGLRSSPPSFLSKPPRQSHQPLSSPFQPRPSVYTTKSPELLNLQRQQSALFLQLSGLHHSLDTATQALKVESSTKDAELEALIDKWKVASRGAAEVLFRGAKDRVNKMGGVGAWKERTRKKQEGWEDDEKQEDESDLTEEQKEQREIQREEMRAEMQKYGMAKAKIDEGWKEKDDESFTMDMMLKQLNIELDVIGYDKEAQRWI